MCVIIICPANKTLPWDILQKAIDRNPDGWGMTAIVNGKMPMVKGFGFPEAKKAWKEFTGHPRVFHARIGTSGKKDLANCHPFVADHENERRWFYHNGCVDIPRFNPDMNDSWHLAEYIQAFPTNDVLHAALEKYARAETSRFVLMTPEKIHFYGKQWFWRDGVGYSNVSCLANIVYTGHQGWYEDGYLTDQNVEVTSDEGYEGLGFDPERKLYSNRFGKDTKLSHPRRPHKGNKWTQYGWDDDDTPYVTSGAGWKGYQSYADRMKRERELEEAFKADKKAEEGKSRAPWRHVDWGQAGDQLSWPSVEEMDYGAAERAGAPTVYIQTHREFSKWTKRWVQKTYDDDGKFVCAGEVDGPYLDGLLITVGNPEISYSGITMQIDQWCQILDDMYDDEIPDEAAIRNLEGTLTPQITVEGERVIIAG